MPELPEVETMCRGLAPVAGCRILTVHFPKSRLCSIEMSPGERTFRRRVEGRTVLSVRRVAKRVVIDLDSDDAVVFEPRMTGRVLTPKTEAAAGARLLLRYPPDPELTEQEVDDNYGGGAARADDRGKRRQASARDADRKHYQERSGNGETATVDEHQIPNQRAG